MGNNRLMDHFFQLLRYAIGASDEFPEDISQEEWREIHELAHRQAILGVLLYGIQKNAALRIDRSLLLRWFAESEQIRCANQKANRVAVELCDDFREQGFRFCILKGQGNALMYPDPYSRTSGDVDIWLEGGRKRIMKMIDEKWPGMLQRYHHVEIPAWQGVPVEIHFTPSYMYSPWGNKRMQQWFEKNAEKQFSHEVELPDGVGRVNIPTREFNIIYQLSHLYRHLFSEGVGLRQVVDYYFLLRGERCEVRGVMEEGRGEREYVKCKMYDVKWKRKDGRGERLALRDTLRWLGMEKFAGALMWVLSEVLGLEEQYLIAPKDEKEGRFLLNEILIGGNFGQYDTRLGNKTGEGIVHRYFRMTIRNMRFIKHYPSEALCEPLFRTWQFFWRMWVKFRV